MFYSCLLFVLVILMLLELRQLVMELHGKWFAYLFFEIFAWNGHYWLAETDTINFFCFDCSSSSHATDCTKIKEPITKEQAELIMYNDVVSRFGPCVKAKLTRSITDNQFSAFVSLAYNIG